MKVRIKSTPDQTFKVRLKSGGKLSPDKAKEMLRDGTAQGHKLTDKQKRYFGYIAGGGTPKANNGASISHLSEGTSDSGNIFQFNGPSHEDGGIPINYQGQKAEVEGDETGFIDNQGDLNIFGNMYVPGTKMKFKTASKKIAKEEDKVNRQLYNSNQLIDNSDPTDKFERFRLNSGLVMASNATRKQGMLADSKEMLSDLQNAMLAAGLGETNTGKAQDGTKILSSRKKKSLSSDLPFYDPNYISQFLTEGQILSRGPANIPIVDDPNTYGDPELTPIQKALAKNSGRNNSIAVKHNNPGNLKYSPWQKKYGAVPGQAGTDGGSFAQFPTLEQGQQAMVNLLNSPSYKNKTVLEGIKRWTGGSPYSKIPDSIKGKKIGDLNSSEFSSLLDTITQGEDSKKYNWEGITSIPTAKPINPTVEASINPPIKPYTTDLTAYKPPTDQPSVETGQPPYTVTNQGTPLRNIIVPPTRKKEPFRNPLGAGQIAPELFTLATERPDFVPGQTFEPNLYQPYQVSFQDQLNRNNASFRAAAQSVGNNPAALSALAAQKYQADNQVQAEEFRTNQGINNQITNQNTELLNNARLQNINLTDQQFVRQEQAKSNTRENIRNAMNSLAGKIQQNKTEKLRYNAYSNLFPEYTFDRNGIVDYIPNEDQTFGPGGIENQSNNASQRTRATYDANGNLKQSVTTTPSANQAQIEAARAYNSEIERRRKILDGILPRR